MADQKQQSPTTPSQSSSDQQSSSQSNQRQQGEQQTPASQQHGGQSQIQGEGNYEAGKQYQDAQHDFAQSGRVQQAAQNAAPRSPQEEQDMARAEQEGRSRAKEEDPQLRKGGEGDSQAH
jgi:hypothetical protein